MSKRIADIYVPGVAIQGLKATTDPRPSETARLKKALEDVSAGTETEAAPGLARRLPAPVRERIATALRANKPLEYLGEENVDDSHFNLDPALATNRWYRTVTPAGARFLTLRLSATGTLLGALIED